MVLKTGVIYLMKDKFQFFSPYDGKIFEFRFAPEIIQDLDVINSEMLENGIKGFITASKIAVANVVFVLAENTYFSKDFLISAQQKVSNNQPEVTKELLKKDADEFIEHVPFDNVVSKTLPLRDGLRVIATNKDFYEAIAIAFEHNGFTLVSVLPGVVLGNGLSLRPTLVELVLYIGILALLITVLSSIFSAIVDVQLNSTSLSSVDQDGNYLLAKFTHDVAASSTILTPATPGTQTSTMQVTINSINYTYSLNSSGNLQVVNNSTNETNVLNSYNTSVSGLTFTRIGTGGSSDTVQVSYTITSRVKERSGYETKSFTTTLGED